MEWIFASVILILLVYSRGFRIFSVIAGGALLILGIAAFIVVWIRDSAYEKRQQAALKIEQLRSYDAEEIKRKEAQAKADRKFDEIARDAALEAQMSRAELSAIPLDQIELENVTVHYREPPLRAMARAPAFDSGASYNELLAKLSHQPIPVKPTVPPESVGGPISGNDLYLRGRIKNNSSRFSLKEITLKVLVKDCSIGYAETCEVVGQVDPTIRQIIPAYQARDLNLALNLGHPISFKGRLGSEVNATQTRGNVPLELIEDIFDKTDQSISTPIPSDSPVSPRFYEPG